MVKIMKCKVLVLVLLLLFTVSCNSVNTQAKDSQDFCMGTVITQKVKPLPEERKP